MYYDLLFAKVQSFRNNNIYEARKIQLKKKNETMHLSTYIQKLN